jgi:Amt family ammonium transporter
MVAWILASERFAAAGAAPGGGGLQFALQGGLIVVLSIVALDKLKIDDPVGAISVHGTAGLWGLLAVPITNDDASITAQLLGLASIFVWVFATSFAIWFLIKKTLGIRVDEQQEYEGVDLSECGLEAYPEFTRAE